MTPQTIVAYWCLPSEADGTAYRRVIDTLAEAQGGARFDPHLSLGSLSAHDPDLDDVCAALQGLVLQPSGVGRSDVFTTSLYVEFAASNQLTNARRLLADRDGFRSTRTFAPHISLCYGPPVGEAALQSEIQGLLSRPIRIDRLQAMQITLPVETHADVAAWSPIETIQVQG